MPRKLTAADLILFMTLFVAPNAVSAQNTASPTSATQEQNTHGTQAEPPVQPIPYSHKNHLAMGLQCQECHTNPEPGDRMTFPATSKCLACHSTIARDRPGIRRLVEFAKSGAAVPWVRVYVLPGWVYWNHRSHSEAKMTCEMCHGNVAELDVMRKVTNVTSMAGCIECHRKNEASIGCKYCHADK
jgi:hypothetical protein